MSKKFKKHPVQRAQPYIARKNVAADENAAQRASTGSLDMIRSALNAGPAVQRVAALQRAANAAAMVQRKDDEDAVLGKFIQRQADEESSPEKFLQRKDDDEAPFQGKFHQNDAPTVARSRRESGGLPGDLKAGIEHLSGMSMDGVRVHRNSSKPAAVQAHAYAQGSDIHLAPGQDRHLPHEAWHVVQQAQGRVAPTMQMAGVAINDDAGLEREADVMGARAQSTGGQAAQLKSEQQ